MLAMTTTTGSVDLAITVAVLIAAVLHAVWNAIAHTIPDQLVGFVLIGATCTGCAIPLVLLAPVPAAGAWPFLVSSAVLHVVYMLLLMQSYRVGDFNQVYPLARGTSPLVVAAAASLFAGEVLTHVQLLGVLVISAGLASLVLVGNGSRQALRSEHHRGSRAALTAAFATGLAIASYTLVDGLGVRQSGTALGYTGWLFLLQGPVIPLLALARRRRGLWSDLRPHLLAGTSAGALSLVAYGLVLAAQVSGALAAVAALRETSVIFGALIGAVFLHEPFGRPRLVATVLVALGIVLINVP